MPANQQLRQLVFFTVLVLAAYGCNDAIMYTNLDGKEAVEMQAILLTQGIDCEKISNKENLWELRVSKNLLPEAVEILQSYGYPMDEFADMGEMFKKEGLVSSPLEERIRYIYALSQEVGQTLSRIGGIITARVHIVLPENDPLSEYFQPSSASVFIKHRPTFDIKAHIHQIKQLVVNSVEGLSYDKVSVVHFSSSVAYIAAQQYVRISGIEIASAYQSRFLLLVFGLSFFIVVLILSCCYLLWQTVKMERSISKAIQKRNINAELPN